MFGSARDRAVTDGWMCGSPSRVISVVLMLYSCEPNVLALSTSETYKGGSGISCMRTRAVPTMPFSSTQTAIVNF